MTSDVAAEPTLELPPVVSAAWVTERIDDLVIADVRWYLDGRSGHDAYLGGHLPGAVWVDVDADLSDPPSPAGGRHPWPSPADFAARIGDLGIGDDDTVVAYDDQGGAYAARLVWMLRRLGQPAALLDGGLPAWAGEVESGPVQRAAALRMVRAWPDELFRTADDVEASIGQHSTLVLDARAPGRYTSAGALPSETRVGHVPGAVSAPFAGNLNEDGTFRTPQELKARFEELGIGAAEDVILYCGSGVTACHDLLAIERAGLPSPSLYPGSWSAWSADPSRPVTAGDQP